MAGKIAGDVAFVLHAVEQRHGVCNKQRCTEACHEMDLHRSPLSRSMREGSRACLRRALQQGSRPAAASLLQGSLDGCRPAEGCWARCGGGSIQASVEPQQHLHMLGRRGARNALAEQGSGRRGRRARTAGGVGAARIVPDAGCSGVKSPAPPSTQHHRGHRGRGSCRIASSSCADAACTASAPASLARQGPGSGLRASGPLRARSRRR